MASPEVQQVIDTLKVKPGLVNALHAVFQLAYEQAGNVTLTQDQKAELFDELADAIRLASVTGF